MQQVGGLRYCSMRQRARRVKLMLDWGVHGRRMKLMGLDDSGQFFLKNLKLIKNNDNALPKTKPLYSHIQRTMPNLYGNGLTKSYRL